MRELKRQVPDKGCDDGGLLLIFVVVVAAVLRECVCVVCVGEGVFVC